MEIQGKIIAVMPAQSGVSQRTGKAWKTQQFVIETEGQYPKRCVFSVFGEERLNTFNIQQGEALIVSFDIDAREYNGRWYNDVQAWKVTRPQAAQPVQQPVQKALPVNDPRVQQVAQALDAEPTDLPF